jgi:hypothetical protein
MIFNSLNCLPFDFSKLHLRSGFCSCFPQLRGTRDQITTGKQSCLLIMTELESRISFEQSMTLSHCFVHIISFLPDVELKDAYVIC